MRKKKHDEEKYEQDTLTEAEQNQKNDDENPIENEETVKNHSDQNSEGETVEAAEVIEAETAEEPSSDINEEQYKEKLAALEEQNLRLRSEFANFKRRVEREQKDFADYIRGEIIRDLLPILDDFKIMLENSSSGDSEQTMAEGAKIIYEKFKNVLEKEGLEKIESSGKPFDPQIHEALMMQPINDKKQHDIILDVFQEGFKLKDKLLRPSKVIVGKFEEKQENSSD